MPRPCRKAFSPLRLQCPVAPAWLQGVGHIALFALPHDRHDLALEGAGFSRALGAVLAFDGERILLIAADAPLGGDIFSRHAHVDGLEGLVQRTHHHIDQFGVTMRAPQRPERLA